MKTEHPLVQLARSTIEAYIRERRVLEPTHALGELGICGQAPLCRSIVTANCVAASAPSRAYTVIWSMRSFRTPSVPPRVTRAFRHCG